MAIDNHQFVFISGLHRSGTSVFFQSLKKHPEISGFSNTGAPEDEGQHLQSVFPPAADYGGPGKFGLQPEMHLTEKSPLVTEDNRNKLLNEWSQYWDTEKTVLLEKSPPNLIKMRFLQALFPQSKFIVIKRHPIATSLATKKWSRNSLYTLIKHWVVCHNIYQNDIDHLDYILEFKYEDYIGDHKKIMEEVLAFIDIPPKDIDVQLKSGINDKYFSWWQRTRNHLLTHYYIKYIEKKFGKAIRRHGYDIFIENHKRILPR